MLPLKIGNIREKSLMEIWTRNPVLIKLRNRENIRGWCGSCSIRDICGGCRARAYGYFRDVFGPDPRCFREKASGEHSLARGQGFDTEAGFQ